MEALRSMNGQAGQWDPAPVVLSRRKFKSPMIPATLLPGCPSQAGSREHQHENHGRMGRG